MKIDNRFIEYKEIMNAKNIELSKDEAFIEDFILGHQFLMEEISQGKPVYGVTTGYGSSGKNYLTFEDSQTLQKNLYRFHGCGVGENLNYEISKYTVLIRLISLSKGNSGVSYELLQRLELLLEKDIIPIIPSLGSVGASGDLTPLSYVAAVIAGEREVYYNGSERRAKDVFAELEIEPYVYKPKEALALMNGTVSTFESP